MKTRPHVDQMLEDNLEDSRMSKVYRKQNF